MKIDVRLFQRLHIVHQLRDGQYVPQTVENTVRSQHCVDVRALSHAEAGPYVLAHAAASVLKVSILDEAKSYAIAIQFKCCLKLLVLIGFNFIKFYKNISLLDYHRIEISVVAFHN